jgi:hypothetical protein
MVKENQWDMEIRQENNLLNYYLKNNNQDNSESNFSGFDKHYVYYIRPSDLKSY